MCEWRVCVSVNAGTVCVCVCVCVLCKLVKTSFLLDWGLKVRD